MGMHHKGIQFYFYKYHVMNLVVHCMTRIIIVHSATEKPYKAITLPLHCQWYTPEHEKVFK